ncbi:MAG: TolC family protein [Candidatus Zixiibacteriota bacterium]
MPLSTRAIARLLLLLSFWLTQPTVAAAQSDISEEEFLMGLTEDHPSVVALRSVIADPVGEARGAGLWPNPDIWFERESPGEESGQSKLGLSWTPPIDGRRSLSRNAARESLESARLTMEHERLVLRLRMRGDFAAWVSAQARVDALAELSARADSLAGYVAERAAAGEESRLVAQRMSMAVSELRAEFARAEADLASARATASIWSDRINAASRPTWPELPEAPETHDAESHPVLAASLHRMRAADYERRLGQRWLEAPSFDVGWLTQDGVDGSDGPAFGLTLSVPLFDRRQGERAAAGLRFEARSAQAKRQRIEASREWEAARDSYNRLRRAALDQPPANTAADSVLIAAAAAFRAGETSATDFLETLRAVQSFQVVTIDLYTAALEAHRRLEAAAGHSLLGY